MASLFKKGNKIYITWYDIVMQKPLNKSLNLDSNAMNWKKAEKIKRSLEEQLAAEKEKFSGLGIKRNTIKSAFNHFLSNNSSKHPSTIKDYYRFYNKFIETFNEDEQCTVITKISAENWLNKIKQFNQKKNSIFGYYKQFNHFLNFLFEYNYIPMFKINRDVKPKMEVVEKIVFSIKDLVTVFEQFGTEKKTENFQNLIYMLYYTGLRASDLLSLEINNVDIDNRQMKYYSPKRKIHRAVSFHEELVPIFKRIAETQSTGKVLDYNGVESLQRAINRYFASLNFNDKHYTSRTFRKTFITIARKYKMDESTVKELVGHSHSSTTDRFYNKIDFEQMSEELKKYPTIKTLKETLQK